MDQDRDLGSAYRGTVLSNLNLHVVVSLLSRMPIFRRQHPNYTELAVVI